MKKNASISYAEDTKKQHKILGSLAKKATVKAVKKAKRSDLSITFLDGQRIIKEGPSGRQTTISIIANNRRKVEIGSKEKIS